MKSGSVGAVENCRHPVTLAKHVLMNTDHVLIVGEGANKLATEISDEIRDCAEDNLCLLDNATNSESDDLSKMESLQLGETTSSDKMQENASSEEGQEVTTENTRSYKVQYNIHKT